MTPVEAATATALVIVMLAAVIAMAPLAATDTRTRQRLVNLGTAERGRRTLPQFGMKRLRNVGFAVAVLLALTHGVLLGAVLVVLTLTGGIAHRQWSRQRSLRQYDAALPRFMDDMTRGLRSGTGLHVALQEAADRAPGQLGEDVTAVVRRSALGESLSASLEQWAIDRPTASVRLCVGAMTLAMRTGGSQALAIESAAATVRQALVARDVARTHATEAQASAAALTLLPLVISGPVLLTNADAQAFMFGTFVGQACLLVGISLDVAGAFWMTTLIKRVMP